MPTREQIVSEARAWMRTPWHHQASARKLGTDCIGLVAGVARELSIEGIATYDATPQFKGYGREPTREMLESGCDAFLDRITLNEALPGDLLLLRHDLVRHSLHIAIITTLDPMYMIHAHASAKMVVENRVDEACRSRIMRVYRYRGVD